MIFRFFWLKLPQIRTKYLCRARNNYRTLRGRYQVDFRKEKTHNQSFIEFSKTEAINLKTNSLIFSRCNPFQSWPSAAQDTYVYS